VGSTCNNLPTGPQRFLVPAFTLNTEFFRAAWRRRHLKPRPFPSVLDELNKVTPALGVSSPNQGDPSCNIGPSAARSPRGGIP